MADARRAELLATLARSTAVAAAAAVAQGRALEEQARAYAELAQLEAGEAGVRVEVAVQPTWPANDATVSVRYATAEDNPLGSPRAFLNAHRRRAFPTFKRGRTITATWTDVETWMRDPARRVKAAPANDLDEQFERLKQACEKPVRRRRAG